VKNARVGGRGKAGGQLVKEGPLMGICKPLLLGEKKRATAPHRKERLRQPSLKNSGGEKRSKESLGGT